MAIRLAALAAAGVLIGAVLVDLAREAGRPVVILVPVPVPAAEETDNGKSGQGGPPVEGHTLH